LFTKWRWGHIFINYLHITYCVSCLRENVLLVSEYSFLICRWCKIYFYHYILTHLLFVISLCHIDSWRFIWEYTTNETKKCYVCILSFSFRFVVITIFLAQACEELL